jgi:hypothetical protein
MRSRPATVRAVRCTATAKLERRGQSWLRITEVRGLRSGAGRLDALEAELEQAADDEAAES